MISTNKRDPDIKESMAARGFKEHPDILIRMFNLGGEGARCASVQGE